MTDRQMLDTLLRGADPVPNQGDPPSGAWSAELTLLEIERKSKPVQTQPRETRRTTPPAKGSRWKPWWAAAAAFAAVIVIGVVALLVRGGDDAPPATTAATTTTTSTTTTTTTTTVVPGSEQIDLVMRSIAAWNAGDFEAWTGFYVPQTEDDFLFSHSVMNSNEQIEVTGQCEMTEEGVDSVTIECPIYVKDDFHGAGGLSSDATMTVVVSDTGLILDESRTTYEEDDGQCCPRWETFHQSFFRWLLDAHPDVYAEIGPEDLSDAWQLPGYAGGDPEHMKIALEYVDEFVAQTRAYPLRDGVV